MCCYSHFTHIFDWRGLNPLKQAGSKVRVNGLQNLHSPVRFRVVPPNEKGLFLLKESFFIAKIPGFMRVPEIV